MKSVFRFSKGSLYFPPFGKPFAELVMGGDPYDIGPGLKRVDFTADGHLSRVETERSVFVLVEGEGE